MRAHQQHTNFSKDGRRKHHHFEAKIFYKDGDVARTYTDRKHAVAFADRQRKSPVVRMARVTQVS